MNFTLQNVVAQMKYMRVYIASFIFLTSVCASIVVHADGPTIHTVGPLQTYATIQAAVNAATAGDIIQIAAGTYNENVSINKKLQILGAGEALTILDGNTPTIKAGNGVFIATGVKDMEIAHLTVQNFKTGSGIHANGGNNGLNIHHVTVQGNGVTGGTLPAGIYANGPVDGVTITGVSALNNKSRGIVIWNGFKKNITITDNTVTGNNCCGIDLQDGTASGVNISRNVITGNTDSGLGVTGLMGGAGANIIADNVITDNGRFGIEIKLPNGTGLETGDGSIVISGNTVTRSAPASTELRDHAGIAVFRRSMVTGNTNNNADIPKGVVIKNNTVSGFVQPSASDGFGIVVEGISMTIYGNTLSGNDVDLQQQAGHNNYHANTSGDGDQSNLTDQYFGRGNSPVVCANFHDNGGATPRSVGTVGSIGVENSTKSLFFCTIQKAIDDPLTTTGDIITIHSGTYTELVNVNKSVRLTSDGAAILTSPASGTNNKIINVSAADVQIHGLSIVVNRPFAQRAISVTNANNVTLYNNIISSTGTGASWPRVGIYVEQTVGSGNTALIYGNTIYGTDASTPFEGRGISTFQIHGVVGGDTVSTDKNSIYAWFDVLSQFNSGGELKIKNNDFLGGGVDVTEPNTGPVLIESNNFTPMSSTINTQTLLLKNIASATVSVKNNIFAGFKTAINNANSTNVTYEGNTFNPSVAHNDFTNVLVTNKVVTSAILPPRAMDITFVKNSFNGNGSAGGTGVAFFNHNATGATFGTVVFAGNFATKNTFSNTLSHYIFLDGQTFVDSQALSAVYPEYAASNGTSSTTGAPYAGDISALVNDFGGMTSSVDVSTKLMHDPNNSDLGLITFQPLNGDTTLSSLTISEGTLVPVFDPLITSYTVTLPTGTAVPTVHAVANAALFDASVQINQAAALPGTATVVVTSQSGATATYTIVLQAAPTPTTQPTSFGGSGGGYSAPVTIVNTPQPPENGNANTNATPQGNTEVTDSSTNSNSSSGAIFHDISGHWGESYITRLAEKCGLTGYVDSEGARLGEFRPNAYIARSELINIMFSCEGKIVPTHTDMVHTPFSDVDNEWFHLAVRSAKELGWIEGYNDGTFRPYAMINRAEAIKIILRSVYEEEQIKSATDQKFHDVAINEWYARYINFACDMHIVTGYEDSLGNALGSFFPNNELTRAEAAKIIVLVKGY